MGILIVTSRWMRRRRDCGAAEVRELKELLGCTEQSLAEYLRVSVSTVGRWVRGERQPTGIYRDRVLGALDDARTCPALNERRTERSA